MKTSLLLFFTIIFSRYPAIFFQSYIVEGKNDTLKPFLLLPSRRETKGNHRNMYQANNQYRLIMPFFHSSPYLFSSESFSWCLLSILIPVNACLLNLSHSLFSVLGILIKVGKIPKRSIFSSTRSNQRFKISS